jgi:hypothetical protein
MLYIIVSKKEYTMTHSTEDMIKLLKKNSAAMVTDKFYGMCSSTRIAHKKANRGDMDIRAVQYALAMTGNEVPHSSGCNGMGVKIESIAVTGYKTPQKRAVSVNGNGLDGEYHIPNWDYVELGVLSA